MTLLISKEALTNVINGDSDLDIDVGNKDSDDNPTFNLEAEGNEDEEDDSSDEDELSEDIGEASTQTYSQSSENQSPALDFSNLVAFEETDRVAINLPPNDETHEEKQVSRRIIYETHSFKALQEISAHGPQSVKIVSEVRVGLISELKLKCMMRNMTFIPETNKPVDEMDINTSAVVGCG
ncbi:unnamed protein product [Parnassius apollo]|uniref:(apollo) hypothetical protein n=1 Tax=Parnassius apollo TaxID=110799 RepID=A0A8S3X6G2_PARAO|nr:unnamed protein product [Parnassius apollo]